MVMYYNLIGLKKVNYLMQFFVFLVVIAVTKNIKVLKRKINYAYIELHFGHWEWLFFFFNQYDAKYFPERLLSNVRNQCNQSKILPGSSFILQFSSLPPLLLAWLWATYPSGLVLNMDRWRIDDSADSQSLVSCILYHVILFPYHYLSYIYSSLVLFSPLVKLMSVRLPLSNLL